MSEGRVLIFIDEACGVTVEAFASLDFPEVQFFAADDDRVKAIDFPHEFTASFGMEIREEDREKMLAMFGPSQIPLATSISYQCDERTAGYVPLGPPRGKKGKFKKDWMR